MSRLLLLHHQGHADDLGGCHDVEEEGFEAAHTLVDRLGPGFDVEGVLNDLQGDTRNFDRNPRKHILVAPEEVDEPPSNLELKLAPIWMVLVGSTTSI
jgi:hypothetical protein